MYEKRPWFVPWSVPDLRMKKVFEEAQRKHKVSDYNDIPESYDMTLEAVIAKTMWILGETQDRRE